MNAQELSIPGAWLIKSRVFSDDRGTFTEWFKSSALQDATGVEFIPAQANISVSRQGVIRGIHYSLAHSGQAKLVTVLRGSILDVAVDVRIGSPTFGKYDSVTMHAGDGTVIFLNHDLAHAFQALEDDTVVSYLVSSEYDPLNEHEISPLCPTLGIKWNEDIPIVLSEKDRMAPDLIFKQNSGLLPA